MSARRKSVKWTEMLTVLRPCMQRVFVLEITAKRSSGVDLHVLRPMTTL